MPQASASSRTMEKGELGQSVGLFIAGITCLGRDAKDSGRRRAARLPGAGRVRVPPWAALPRSLVGRSRARAFSPKMGPFNNAGGPRGKGIAPGPGAPGTAPGLAGSPAHWLGLIADPSIRRYNCWTCSLWPTLQSPSSLSRVCATVAELTLFIPCYSRRAHSLYPVLQSPSSLSLSGTTVVEITLFSHRHHHTTAQPHNHHSSSLLILL